MPTRTTHRASARTPAILPERVHETLARHLIADGLPIVFDLERSHGSWIVDAVTGEEYLDFFSFFASLPLGFRHPALITPASSERLLRAALHKPSNSDVDTVELASFVDTFARVAMKPPFRHLFFVEGGAMAVENALKTAFDWKVRKNLAAGRGEIGTKVIHFLQAFHGRSGYTMSLTNTQPAKTDFFPKFDWPRVRNPKLRFPAGPEELRRVVQEEEAALREIEEAFRRSPHEIASIIIEPIQSEGGDNHFRGEFLEALRAIADREDAILIFDEVQTGFGLTGRFWAYEHFGVTPDIVAFAKKAQVGGIMAGPRIDEVPDNVFEVSSRLNSTWGGNLLDMVRSEIILGVIEEDDLLGHVSRIGPELKARIEALGEEFPRFVSNVRGRGLLSAFDCPSRAERDALIARAREERLVVLPCGEASIRLRPALTVSSAEVEEAAKRLRQAIATLRKSG